LFHGFKRTAVLLAHDYGFNGGWIGRRTNVSTDRWPDYSPVSITKQVYEALRPDSQTVLDDYKERGSFAEARIHVLIGHPDPTDPRSIWNQSCEKGEFAAGIAMFPIHHALAEINAPIDPYIPKVDAVLGITGLIGTTPGIKSALAHWKSKIIPVDMAIDVKHFPRVKRRFNPKGQRKFLFERAHAARRLVETTYTWERFTNTVLTELKSVAIRKGLNWR
jgi:hypothetical protein